MIFHFGISHKASVQPLFPVLGENCCQFECNQWIFMYVFWANCKTNMDGIIHELLTMNWVCFFTHRNVIQTSATSPKRLSVYWGVSREYTTPCNANLCQTSHHLQDPQIPFSHLHLSHTTSNSLCSTAFLIARPFFLRCTFALHCSRFLSKCAAH